MCHYLSTLLVESVVETREDQIRKSLGVVRLYAQSWEIRSKRIKQLVQEPPRVGDTVVEKLGPSFKDSDGRNDAPASPGEFVFDAGAEHCSV